MSAATYMADVLCERSAGALYIQIRRDDELVWSHDYLSNGCSSSEYERLLMQAIDDCLGLESAGEYAGCDRDDDGDVIDYDHADYLAYTLMSYDPANGWHSNYHTIDGDRIAIDLIATNRDRLPPGITAMISLS